MTITINWAVVMKGAKTDPAAINRFEALNLITEPPENFYAYIKTKREASAYLKCYAFIDYFKNAYIIKAPLDLRIKYTKENSWLSIEGIDQEFYDSFVQNRVGQSSENDPPLVSIFPNYVFYSDASVEMSSLPLPLLDGVKNTRHIPGRFNISKWIRPVDWSFEIEDIEKEIIVKRGDPLFIVLFDTPNNQKVILNRVPYTEELKKVIFACTGLKKRIKNLRLEKCYEIAENFLTMWRKYRGRM